MTHRRIVFYFATLMTLTFSIAAFPSYPVTVDAQLDEQHSISMRFDHIPRLDEVVLRGLKQTGVNWKSVDWLASGLYDINTAFTGKKQVLAAIAEQQQIASQRYHGSWYYWSQLGRNLEAMHFAKKIFQSIDPDETRLSKPLNPQLIGHWLISLRKPQKSVLVLGGVSIPGVQRWQPRRDAKYYAQSAGLLDTSIPAITVIQPDGHVEKHPVGYWNQTFSEVAPGATVYVPLPVEELPAIYRKDQIKNNPNDLVIELLRNRLP